MRSKHICSFIVFIAHTLFISILFIGTPLSFKPIEIALLLQCYRNHVERQWDITNHAVIVSNIFRRPKKSTTLDSMGCCFGSHVMFHVGSATLYLWSWRRCATVNQRIRLQSGTVWGFTECRAFCKNADKIHNNYRTCQILVNPDRLNTQQITNCVQILQDSMMTVMKIMKFSPLCHWF